MSLADDMMIERARDRSLNSMKSIGFFSILLKPPSFFKGEVHIMLYLIICIAQMF